MPEIGEDLCELADDDIVGGQRGLCLKGKSMRKHPAPLTGKPALAKSEQGGEAGWSPAGYLHGGAVSLAADQRGGDIGVGVFIIQINHVGHPAWQEQLVPLVGLVLEQDAVNVAAWTEGKVWERKG